MTRYVTVHFYDPTARIIIRTASYRTRALAWAAIRRAQRAGKIAMFSRVEAPNRSRES